MISPNFENIPAELTALSQWVCWNLETRNGKETKVPYQPNAARARVDDPSTHLITQKSQLIVKM